MKTKLSILLIENSEHDAVLIMRELGKLENEILFERVDNKKDFQSAISNKIWDIIISEYTLPGLSGIAAMKAARKKNPDIPFIIVSDSIGDENAAEAIKLGASDYLAKSNLRKLGTAAARALIDSDQSREKNVIKEMLKESAAYYRTLVQTSPDAIIVIDKNGIIRFVNSQGIKLTGCRTASELVGNNILNIIAHGDKEKVSRNFRESFEGNTAGNLTCRLKHTDGRIIHTEIRQAPVISNSAKASSLLIIARNITERMQAEEQLYFHSAIIDQVYNGVGATDMKGNIIYWNKFAEKLHGYTKEEVMGKNLFDLIFTPEIGNIKEEIIAQMFEKGYWKGEVGARRKDGSVFPIRLDQSILKDDSGNPIAVVGVSSDISEKKESEAKILRLNRIYELLSSINKLLVRAKNINQLINETCEIAYQIGKYQKVWIGLLNKKEQTVLPAACKGDSKRCLEDLKIQVEELSQCPISKAITKKRFFVCNNAENLSYPCHNCPIRETNQFLSVASFPLFNAGETVGVISFYSEERNFFDEDEINLLNELASDISFSFYTKKQEELREKAELALKENEIRHKIAQEIAHIGHWSLDILENKLNWSEEVFRIFGANPAAINVTLEKFYEFIHPDDREKVLTAYETSVKEKSKYSIDHRIMRSNGEIRHVHEQCETTYDDAGKAVYSFGTVHDITDRKMAEEKIVSSEIQLRSVWENSGDGMRLTDENGIITSVNEAFCKLVRMVKNDLVGKPLSVIYASPDHKHIIDKHSKNFAERSVDTHIEKQLRLWDGRTVWFSITNSFLEFENKPPLLLGIFRDITEPKSIEGNIISSEIQFRSVWENSFDSMRLTDQDGIIVDVNSAFCKMMGKTKEEIVGKEYNFVYADKNESGLKRYTEKFKARTVKQKLETSIPLWNGKEIWVELSNSFIEIKNKPPLLLSIFRDISTRREYENGLVEAKNKAEEMNRLKSNFLNNMSHELRTPLVAILGYAHYLSNENKNKEQRELLNGIINGGQRLQNTINQLLNLSAIESGKLKVKSEKVNLTKEAANIVKRLSILAEKKNLYLKLKSAAEPVYSLIDAKYFIPILENLIGNAVKYTVEGGITVEVNKILIDGSSRAAVKVIDTGIGIPRDSLKLIFEEFRQVSEGLSRKYEGSGLGLTIVKRYVDILKGEITVESQVEKGSTFTILLNSADSEETDENTEWDNHAVKEEVSGKRPDSPLIDKRLLLVDDDKSSRDILKLFLTGRFEVDFAENGAKALERAANNDYAAILMDINLGFGMSGLETAKRIRELEAYKDTPIIAVTAYAMEEDRRNFLAQGCTHYLSKPYEKKTLLKVIDAALRND